MIAASAGNHAQGLAYHGKRLGVPVTIVRPFSGYGPDQDTTYPFTAFAERAARRADPFDVWGDGQQVRDFVHVTDIVNATLALVDAWHADGLEATEAGTRGKPVTTPK